MSLWQRIAAATNILVGKMTPDEWWFEYGYNTQSTAGIAVTQTSSLQVMTFLSCVSILAEDFAKLPRHVYKTKADGSREIDTNHWLERLLQSPNDYQSGFEFFEQMQVALLLRGNAYAVILRNWRGEPIALIPVNPDQVWIYEAEDGGVFYQVARRGPHDIAMLRSVPLMVPSEDVLHVRWFSLHNSLYGASRIQLARDGLGLALAQQELAGRLAANNTNLGGVLTTDQKLGKEVAERLKKDWKDKKAGLRNAGDTAVLEQGLKWQALGMTAQDAEFIASRSLSRLEICGLMRVPPHKVGIMERMAGATVEQLDQDYVNNTVTSWIWRWEAKISQTFGLAEQDRMIDFDVEAFLRASMQTRYTAYRTGIQGMFLKPNEVRRKEKLPDDPEGDKLYQPVNMAPLGFEPSSGTDPNASGLGSDQTGLPAEGGHGDPAAVDEVPGS